MEIVHLEDLHIDGRIISKLILKKLTGRVRTELMWLGVGYSRGLL
jgi:hypothetical protein